MAGDEHDNGEGASSLAEGFAQIRQATRAEVAGEVFAESVALLEAQHRAHRPRTVQDAQQHLRQGLVRVMGAVEFLAKHSDADHDAVTRLARWVLDTVANGSVERCSQTLSRIDEWMRQVERDGEASPVGGWFGRSTRKANHPLHFEVRRLAAQLVTWRDRGFQTMLSQMFEAENGVPLSPPFGRERPYARIEVAEWIAMQLRQHDTQKRPVDPLRDAIYACMPLAAHGNSVDKRGLRKDERFCAAVEPSDQAEAIKATLIAALKVLGVPHRDANNIFHDEKTKRRRARAKKRRPRSQTRVPAPKPTK